MSYYLLQGAIEEGLIYALVALGLLVSYRILDIADMTTDGGFVLGAGAGSMMVLAGHPILALPVALIAGMLAGLVTATFQTRLGIPSIIAGIITMTGLYTVNLIVQGGSPNLFYPNEVTIFTLAKKIFGETYGVLIFMILLVALVCGALIYFFRTQLGLSIRATGDNRDMVQASSINPVFTITVALCLSNGLVALGGALLAQKNTQTDLGMGTGVVVIGLASLVLGEIVFRKNTVTHGVLAAVVGAVVYRIIFTIALRYTPDAGYLKIVSAGILAIVISAPTIKNKAKDKIHQRKEQHHA